MLDLVLGTTGVKPYEKELIEKIRNLGLTGTLYIGYPIVAIADSAIEIDAMLTTKEHGLIAIDTKNFGADPTTHLDEIATKQGNIFAALQAKLIEHAALRVGRQLAVSPSILSVHQNTDHQYPDETRLITIDSIPRYIRSLPAISDQHFKSLNAVIQRSTTMRPKKRRDEVVSPDSKGQVLKTIEKEICNFDAWQKKAAIEVPNGPQRIRGLAGSGKTIVLAQKASYLHIKYPQWRIVLTFNTRSLYQQLRELIVRFTFEHTRDEPNWDRLTVMHAWGGTSAAGVYSELCSHYGHQAKDFAYAKSRYGVSKGFEGITRELLGGLSPTDEPIYDAVLIDEAQDLPQPFFELCWHATKKPKRIVYAYDELQNLSDYEMTPPEQLFGKDGKKARVRLKNEDGKPSQDLILPVCYRNAPWTLSTAHALGFGVYREAGLVQMFEDVSLWHDIGYKSGNGAIALGKHVTIERRDDASPDYFYKLLEPDTSIGFRRFENKDAQDAWVAEEIARLLEQDEVQHDDILIIVADPISIRKRGLQIRAKLAVLEIDAHLVGVTSGVDEIFRKGSVAITSIYRAKGNEAPIVFVLDAQYCAAGIELAKRRNILFTGITRSRGWCYVTGVGDDMHLLDNEYQRVRHNDYKLSFDYPTKKDLEKLRVLHREMDADQLSSYENDLAGLSRILEQIDAGLLSIDALPKGVRTQIQKLSAPRGTK